LKNSARMLT
jgi:hypothetical protein